MGTRPGERTQTILESCLPPAQNRTRSGRSVAWLSRLLWEQKTTSSNLVVPTTCLNRLGLGRVFLCLKKEDKNKQNGILAANCFLFFPKLAPRLLFSFRDFAFFFCPVKNLKTFSIEKDNLAFARLPKISFESE
jgi:hypothetical protein